LDSSDDEEDYMDPQAEQKQLELVKSSTATGFTPNYTP